MLLTYTPYGYNVVTMNSTHQPKLIRRLKLIEGQVRGLQDMVEKGAYCIDIITQTSAVKQALSSVEDILMENHLGTCAMSQMSRGGGEKAKAEILKVYRLKRK